MKRRNVLLGLGTAAAGSGILFGSGAFTQVEAERDLTIGIDSDSEALLALRANKDVASVFEDDSTGELVIDTDRLSDDNEGFNVGSTAQIGATDEPFGDEVVDGDEAFKLVNNFDDQGEGDFDPELDVAIDLTDFDPDDDNGTLEFVATADESQTVSSGESRVFEDVESGEEILVAIRIETDSAGEDPGDLEGEVVFQAGSDLSDDDFPAEQEFVGEGEVLNQDQDERFDGDDPITEAVSEAESNETLIVGPGTYDESVSIGTEGLTLEAAEEGAATIEGDIFVGSEGGGGSNPTSADSVVIDGFEIVEPGLDGDGQGIGVTESSDVVIQNNEFEGFRTQISLDFAGGDVEDITIQGNTFSDVNTDDGTAVGALENADGVDILNNEFINNRNDIGTADSTENVTISGNEFTAGNSDSYVSVRAAGLDGQTVLDNNKFDPNGVITADEDEFIVVEDGEFDSS